MCTTTTTKRPTNALLHTPKQVLDACNDWKELVESRAHALFAQLQTEAHLEHPGFKNAKPLLAPKGEYWDTAEDKVLGMFRTKLEAGLTEQEVLARRDVYGDNRPPPVPTNSVLKILLRQLADFIVLILLAGGWVGGCMGGVVAAVVERLYVFSLPFD